MGRRRKKKKISLGARLALLVLILVIGAVGYFFSDEIKGLLSNDTGSGDPIGNLPVEGTMDVHFIDVGQADAILVLDGDKTMLIDTGDNKNSCREKLITYLENLSVTKIDYLILTHPDADHIGGAPQVINGFDVENCILPNVVKDTKIYEDTLSALEDREVNVIAPESGTVYTLSEAQFKILAPNSEEYEDWNDYSVVIKLVFGERSIMLTGDAHHESEGEILQKYSNSELDADVLKVGHHGSRTSSGEDFLNAVTPSYAIISCGEGNEYGHPHAETLSALAEREIPVYRTDERGTIVLHTDGQEITFSFEKSAD